MNNRRSILLITVLLLILIVGHMLNLKFYLYYRLPYLDRLMHPLGGFVTGAVVLYVFDRARITTNRLLLMAAAIVSAIIIGAAWEQYELSIKFTNPADAGYIADTVGDMVSNIIGSVLAFWYMTRTNVSATQSWSEQ